MLDSLGATLRAAREARGWTLEEAEKATRIRARYLAALEAGQIDSLPRQFKRVASCAATPNILD